MLAEELAQETLLVVWNKAEQYDPAHAGAGAWIFTIARNLRIDAARRARLALPEPDPTDEPPPPPIADAVLAAEQKARRVRAALDTLPPVQLEAVRLAFFEDLTHSEIEASLGVPLGTVKSRLRLALSRLRALLKDNS
jgi:RNA polymerase sigma-70 factor (ECF subfamily)